MQDIKALFLEALKASLENRKVTWQQEITQDEWISLFQMADIHNVVPMIYEAIYDCPSIRIYGPGFVQGVKRRTIYAISMQAMKTGEFELLYSFLRANGITPCVVKGLSCRALYPNPDARASSDEDVFIPEEQFAECHEVLTSYGMKLSDPDKDIYSEYEVPYGKDGSPIYIELHKHLFPPESEAYGDLNRFFDGIHMRTETPHEGECGLMEVKINGKKYLTMNPTDHLLYLILHSFKHFLHSGFGLRQVCDINLYANAYGKEIDWNYVLECLREVRADLFAAAMFSIGEQYLTFDPEKACYPDIWKEVSVDPTAMLDDLFASGVFGHADMSRKHSSNITLNAVIADKRGETAQTGTLRTAINAVCLPVNKLSDRFTYLKKMPFLLPVAWVQRVLIYRRETAGNKSGNNAAESIQIGNERVELMRKYGIIK